MFDCETCLSVIRHIGLNLLEDSAAIMAQLVNHHTDVHKMCVCTD